MQTVLKTGAGRETGLGFETARQLGQKGYHVILAARRESQLQPLVERLKREGASASYVVLDITSEDSAREAAGHIEHEFGRLDVLVNNAALMIGGQRLPRCDQYTGCWLWPTCAGERKERGLGSRIAGGWAYWRFLS